jgi:redox-sensitive bicupin YhaK (pirin superfamily)
MSFILNGEIEHYDTKNKEWKPLSKGDVQIIRAGSGISHAENFKPGSEIFQIWFDPDLSKSLLCPATYDDYKAQCFPVSTRDKMIIKDYKGVNSPLDMEASILSISEIILKQGEIEMQLNERNVYSIYLLDGKIELNKIEMEKDDYIKINTETIMMINVIQENSRIFFIESPARPYYKTYYEMFG